MRRALVLVLLAATSVFAQQLAPEEHDFTTQNYRFDSGETLPVLKLHYTTYGKPQVNAQGRTTNAVLVLHGTGGSGHQFVRDSFAGVLFGPGQLLDANKYFIILPDNIGHGASSKPSDGLRERFPHYDYDDMVTLQHLLLTDGLKVNHLRLVMGTSMGCMHSFVWAEKYADFIDAAMPLACLPVQIAGRNRMWRKMSMDAIRNSPDYDGGEYKQQPVGLRTAIDMLMLVGQAPLFAQKQFPTQQKADAYVENGFKHYMSTLDANDWLYALDSSRDYDPSPDLEKITAPLMHVNSADDFINPPELGIAEQEIKRVKKGTFVLIPISGQTRGHGTHTLANVWKQYLQQLLEESAKKP
jgi:homoserine O-acetyltransferase